MNMKPPSYPLSLPRLRVSENRRYIVTEQGRPFFWLGDTAWEFFHRCRREEALRYLDNRQAKRFTVIQAVILAELHGLTSPNAYGNLPLIDLDPERPDEAYFSLVDEYIHMAYERGIYMGLLPTWGDKVTAMWGAGPVIFTEQSAYTYGRYLGERYRETTNIIWILGGDRPAVYDATDTRPVWRAMARGIREGCCAPGEPVLMTYHPSGGNSTSKWLHRETWLDVNMMQSGHGGGHDVPVWEMIARDYRRRPPKPTLDGEPNYEDHPVSPWPKWDPANGYFRDWDVRKQLYRSVFAGGCGVTYGHHSIWQMYTPERQPITHPDRTWEEALDRPGACQVQHLRALVESRPYLTRIPDQALLASRPGQRGDHIRATRDESGSYAFIYLPGPRPVKVRLERLTGSLLKAWWYDPRTGQALAGEEFPNTGTRLFAPPGEGPDWVLVLDDASQNYPAPGVKI